MNRGVARETTFHCDADRVEFGRLLGVGHDRFGVEIHAYCLLPNHYHLLAHCPQGGLSAFMQYVGSVFTRHVNDRLGRDGPLFRGRFHSIPVNDDRQLLATVRYVHRNALDVAGVTDLAGYRWSSHRTYLGFRTRPRWLETETVLEYFGHDLVAFGQFVGSDDGSTPVVDRGNELDALILRTTIDLVVSDFDVEFTRSVQGFARTLTILLTDEVSDPAVRAAAHAILGPSNPVAAKAALRRARRHACAEPLLPMLVDQVRRLVA